MQPVFRYRRWLEDEKQLKPEGPEQEGLLKPDLGLLSIAHIESQLPPRRGPDSSITNYVAALEEVEERLKLFYNGDDDRFQKHSWDMKRAKRIEYQKVANSLLSIVGGSVGERRADDNPVLIGVGLGEFGSSNRLSSLHSSFQSYFVRLARSLGYIVVGLQEYYTSKKCPRCEQFVAQVTIRQLYCRNCPQGRYHHRDVMAAENMSNLARSYLLNQVRPDYLHPVTADGRMPWKEGAITGQDTTDEATTGAISTTAPIQASSPRKRPTSGTTQERRPRKAAKGV
ncbi:hypothetical protein BGZ46_009125 [Entomortierella lignicola]|nr:hypothetical protein BGZ46_009125 [Entomortierella lignicola]